MDTIVCEKDMVRQLMQRSHSTHSMRRHCHFSRLQTDTGKVNMDLVFFIVAGGARGHRQAFETALQADLKGAGQCFSNWWASACGVAKVFLVTQIVEMERTRWWPTRLPYSPKPGEDTGICRGSIAFGRLRHNPFSGDLLMVND